MIRDSLRKSVGYQWWDILEKEWLGVLPNILKSLKLRDQIIPSSLVDVFQAFRSTDPSTVKCVVIGEG